jgi:hypothetical protein
MFSIGILNGPFTTIVLLAIFASPGLAIGAIAGALAWRRHRFWGAGIGALVCCGLWLLGLAYFTDNL